MKCELIFATMSSKTHSPSSRPSDLSKGNGADLQAKVWESNERHKDGGLRYKDEAELKKQRGVAWDVVKSLGSSILEGKELTNQCLPIYLFESRSFLERLTDIWAYAPKYLPVAASIKGNPVERMKHVIAFAVSGLHLLTTIKKPFNPILGETHQALFPDGTEIFCEQTMHHPPTSNWEVVPKDQSYKFWGHLCWGGSCRGNVLKGTQKGECNIDFPDGTRITYTLPEILIKGLMWGDRVMELSGNMVFTDEKNDLECEVVFNPSALGLIKSIFSKSKDSADSFKGSICRIQPNVSSKKKAEGAICTVEGSWLSHLDIDGKRLWEITTVPDGVCLHPNALPSDSRFRSDLVALRAGDVEKAKECKVVLEERQRLEKKLRNEGRKCIKDGANSSPYSKSKSKGIPVH